MVLSFLQLLFVLVGLAQAADPSPYRIEAPDVNVAAGASGNIRVIFAVPDGFHTYRDWVSVEVTDAGGLTFSPPSLPPGVMKDDPAAPGTQRETYETDVLVDLPFSAAAAGTHTVSLHTRYQGCKKALCYLPFEQDLTVQVVAGDGTGDAAPIDGAQAADPAAEADVILTPAVKAPNEVRIHADLQGEWHINKAFVSLTLVEPGAYALGEALLPPGEKSGDPAAGTDREDYTHDLDFVAPISGPPGKATVKVEVAWQACKGVALCKMPTSLVLDVPVEIDPAAPQPVMPTAEATAAATPEAPAAAAPIGLSSDFAAAAEQGTLALVLFCFLAGIGVSFTPCVLPMVPITMGLIGARGAGSRARAVSLSAAYVLGLAAVYTLLGLFAGVTGALFGSWLQSPVVVFGISGFFFVMGFSMFGFFDIGVPSFIANRMSGSGGGGYVGAVLLGCIGAVLAGPCSGPVVASILALIGQKGEVGFGGGLMFSFALGMGMIFLVTGAAGGWLPQRGAWMITVKKGFGVILWLGAIFYASSHLSTTVTALSTAAVLLVTGVYAWPDPEDGEGPMMVSGRRLYTLVASLVGAYLLLGTLWTQGFILPPMASAGGSAVAANGPKITWVRTEAEAIELAKASGKPLMIDFTAEWCQACHEMERFTYTDPAVIAAADGYVTAMIDCTEKADPNVLAIQKKYGVTGLPTVVFATADGKVLGGTVGFVKAPDFVGEMKKALEAKG